MKSNNKCSEVMAVRAEKTSTGKTKEALLCTRRSGAV